MLQPVASQSPPESAGRPGSRGESAAYRAAPPARRFLFRLLMVVLAAALLAGSRAAALRGLVFPVRIEGKSMAESLAGRHFALTCGDCGYPFRGAASLVAPDSSAVCPNCGFAENTVQAADLQPGRRVWIDAGRQVGGPRRWDVVAAASSESADRWEAKRVVGLPGEFVELREGDVWINGRRVAKTFDQLRQVAVKVHDDRYRPRRGNRPPRWRNAGGTDLWRATTEGYAIQAPAARSRHATRRSTDGDWHWLEYRHRPCMPSAWPPRANNANTPLLDYYPSNQDLPRGRMFTVDDLLLEFVADLAGAGRLACELATVSEVLRMEWHIGRRTLELWHNGRRVAVNRTVVASRARPVRIALARCDGVLWFVVDERVRLRYALDDGSPGSHSSKPAASSTRRGLAQRVRIGVGGPLEARLESPRVFRDLYYFHPLSLERPWSAGQLEEDEYLLLGDNVPVSRDSRHWDSPGVPRERIWGRVLAW